jgi:hypothetical protein
LDGWSDSGFDSCRQFRSRYELERKPKPKVEKMSYKIYAPHVHLLVFHLPESSIFTTDSKVTDKDWLWERCDDIVFQTLRQEFQIEDYINLQKQPNNPHVILTDKTKLKNISKPAGNDFYIHDAVPLEGEILLDSQESLKILGFAYPLRIDNSYGLWLNLHRPEKEDGERTENVDVDILRYLNPKNCFFVGQNNDFVGQSLIITARLTPEDAGKDLHGLRKIAEECLKAFFPEDFLIPPCNREDFLLGSAVFQYGSSTDLPSSGSIYVWLWQSEETKNKFHRCYKEFLDLSLYRVQVIIAYQEITKLFELLETRLNEINDQIDLMKSIANISSGKSEIERLKNSLKQLPSMARDYDKMLAKIYNFQRLIDKSAKRYDDVMQKLGARYKNKDIRFFYRFSQKNCPYVQDRIETELSYFKDGSNWLDRAIASIRSQVSIEQAELESQRQDSERQHERYMQFTILAVGSGISAGAIFATSYSAGYTHPIVLPLDFLSPFVVVKSIYYSLIFSLFFGVATYFVISIGYQITRLIWNNTLSRNIKQVIQFNRIFGRLQGLFVKILIIFFGLIAYVLSWILYQIRGYALTKAIFLMFKKVFLFPLSNRKRR